MAREQVYMRHSISLAISAWNSGMSKLIHLKEFMTSPKNTVMLDKVWVRYENEIMQMAEFEFAAIIAEYDWQSIIRFSPRRSKLLPKTILASIIVWEQRYGVHFWACPNCAFAEKLTYRILERYCRDQTCKPKLCKRDVQVNTSVRSNA